MKLNLRVGDRFRLLKDGDDLNGLRLKKETIVTLYDLVLKKNPHPYSTFHLEIKAVSTGGRLLCWILDDKDLEKIED
jgi:hypothetical protein